MDATFTGKIFYSETNDLKWEGQRFRFADIDEANRMNEAMNTFQREKLWPGYAITIVNLAKPTETRMVFDSELAHANWRGPKAKAVDQVFLWLAFGSIFLVSFVALTYHYVFLR